MAIAFDRESSDFLAGVNVESKETFDLNTVCSVVLALSTPGRVGPGAVRSDIMIGVFADGPWDVVAEKVSGLRFLGGPPVVSVLSSGGVFQKMPDLALPTPGREAS